MIKLAALALLCLSAQAMAQTVRVVDGDTIELGDSTYRLHGVDSPEAGQKCASESGGTWQCGRAATAMLVSLTEGKAVVCDNRGRDEYGRIIAVCLAEGVDLSSALVVGGLGWAFRRFSDDYVPQEDVARSLRLGIWQAETQTAWDYRAERWAVAAQEAPEGCPIKGNIGTSDRIYHAPWSPWYERTKITEAKGERWFCSETEALEAGWRAPLWGAGRY